MVLQADLDREVDASVAGICGAFCGACPVYRAWAEQDHGKLEALSHSLNVPLDRLLCTGCRTPDGFCFGGECEVKRCAEHRGVAFCPDCDDYPCNRIRRAQVAQPIHALLARDAKRIREAGWYTWLREQDATWRCPSCGSRIAADATKCAHCGHGLPKF